MTQTDRTPITDATSAPLQVIQVGDGIYHAPMWIDAAPCGYMDGAPAEWCREPLSPYAIRLHRFQIGEAFFDRHMAIQMTGKTDVMRQEQDLESRLRQLGPELVAAE